MARKWNGALSVLTIILCLVIFYINFSYYAGVIGMGFFVVLLCMSLFYSLYGLLNKKNSRRILFVNSGIIALIIMTFIVAIPRYTYDDAKQAVMSDYVNHRDTDSVVMASLENQTVPSKSHSSLLLYNRLYYVGIKDEQQNQMIYYVVDPTQGQPIKLNEPY